MSNLVPPQPVNIPYLDINGNVAIAWQEYNLALSRASTGATVLTTDVSGTLPIANGGTGITTNVAFTPLCGGTTTGGVLQSVASLGSSGDLLQSNGAGVLPSFQTIAGTANPASQAEQEAATSTTKWVAPATMKYHPGVAKAWCQFDESANIITSHNITSVVRNSTGKFTVTLSITMSSANYLILLSNMVSAGMADVIQVDYDVAAPTATVIKLVSYDFSYTVKNPKMCYLAVFGDV